MKRGGNGRGAFRVGKIGLADNVNILGGSKDRHGLDRDGQSVAVGLRSESVEVKKVVVLGMVGGEEKTQNTTRVARRSGDEISDGRRSRVSRDLGGERGAGGEEKRVGSGRAWGG